MKFIENLKRVLGVNIPENATDAEIDAILAEIEPINKQVGENTAQTTELSNKLSTVESVVATLIDDNATLKQSLTDLQTSLTASVNEAITTATATFESKVTEVANALNEVKLAKQGAAPSVQASVVAGEKEVEGNTKKVDVGDFLNDFLNGKISKN